MTTEQRIQAFVALGHEIRQLLEHPESPALHVRQQQLKSLAGNLYLSNAWFSPDQVEQALRGLVQLLDEASLRSWLQPYMDHLEQPSESTIGVVMAGNLPAVGFHDLLCVLISGRKLTAKLSSDDRLLLPALAAMLVAIEPGFADRIHFSDGKLLPFKAIIATGSNNSSRYFEYYFAQYPRIIRKSRTSMAILNGQETEADLAALANDVFSFYGMGCRNITHLCLPEGFSPIRFLEQCGQWSHLQHHSKYFHNYEYHRAGYLINQIAHFDNGFLLLKEDEAWHSPVAVLHYSVYTNYDELKSAVLRRREEIQVVAMLSPDPDLQAVPLGTTQMPGPADYADGVDTLQFILQNT